VPNPGLTVANTVLTCGKIKADWGHDPCGSAPISVHTSKSGRRTRPKPWANLFQVACQLFPQVGLIQVYFLNTFKVSSSSSTRCKIRSIRSFLHRKLCLMNVRSSVLVQVVSSQSIVLRLSSGMPSCFRSPPLPTPPFAKPPATTPSGRAIAAINMPASTVSPTTRRNSQSITLPGGGRTAAGVHSLWPQGEGECLTTNPAGGVHQGPCPALLTRPD
jgi:hypothetical protein